jgi:hypothetical protein
MANWNNTSPNWQATGIEPPDSLKKSGFLEGYKPPAEYFNWLFTQISKCITELQGYATPTVGTYRGTGETTNLAFASLGYKPKKVEILQNADTNCTPLHLIQGAPYSAQIKSSTNTQTVTATWTNSGLSFSGSSASIAMNETDTTYYYIIYK